VAGRRSAARGRGRGEPAPRRVVTAGLAELLPGKPPSASGQGMTVTREDLDRWHRTVVPCVPSLCRSWRRSFRSPSPSRYDPPPSRDRAGRWGGGGSGWSNGTTTGRRRCGPASPTAEGPAASPRLAALYPEEFSLLARQLQALPDGLNGPIDAAGPVDAEYQAPSVRTDDPPRSCAAGSDGMADQIDMRQRRSRPARVSLRPRAGVLGLVELGEPAPDQGSQALEVGHGRHADDRSEDEPEDAFHFFPPPLEVTS
jgi:hypothetical protein